MKNSVSELPFDKIVDKLLDMLSFMLINYFETYEFGSRSDVLPSFSLLPPIVRYKVLIFLYNKYPNNIHVIGILALAIVKAFDKEEDLDLFKVKTMHKRLTDLGVNCAVVKVDYEGQTFEQIN